eukprot:scaffold44703_cov18-Tisochrysis_lutea.AAC.4
MLISTWVFFRYMVVGMYVGFATVSSWDPCGTRPGHDWSPLHLGHDGCHFKGSRARMFSRLCAHMRDREAQLIMHTIFPADWVLVCVPARRAPCCDPHRAQSSDALLFVMP